MWLIRLRVFRTFWGRRYQEVKLRWRSDEIYAPA